MENANSPEYLEKIKMAVIENLKKTAPVPSVQMQDVPRQGLGMSDEQEDELDDLDEDENKDVRVSQRQWEKRVERQDEFEESDDEDIARANGVYKTNGRMRLETNYGVASKEDDTMDVDSGVATPAEPAAVAAPADNDDTMIDEAQADTTEVAEQTEPLVEQPAAQTSKDEHPEVEKSKVDDDGDVNMDDAAPATSEERPTEAPIKKEEAEAPESELAKKSPVPAVAADADKVATAELAACKQRASAESETAISSSTPEAEAKAKSPLPAAAPAAAATSEASEQDAATAPAGAPGPADVDEDVKPGQAPANPPSEKA